MKRAFLVMAISALALVGMALPAMAAIDTDAVSVVTSVGGDLQDTVLAIVPIVLGITLAVGLTLWGIRYVLRKFNVRTS